MTTAIDNENEFSLANSFSDPELTAVVSDAQLRREEALRVIRVLWADRDDEAVEAELMDLFGYLRQVEAALKAAGR